jgi:hypothetical protein
VKEAAKALDALKSKKAETKSETKRGQAKNQKDMAVAPFSKLRRIK